MNLLKLEHLRPMQALWQGLFTSLRDGNRPHRMEGANISTEHSPGSAPPLPNVAEHRFHVSR